MELIWISERINRNDSNARESYENELIFEQSYSANSFKPLTDNCTEMNESILKCPQCSYITNRRPNLLRHARTHTRPYHCDICVEKFSDLRRLRSHIKTKHPVEGMVKDHKCSMCPYETNYRQHLRAHMNIHDKQFSCEICSTAFTNANNLQRHIRKRHTEIGLEKDFKCPQCSYQTNYKERLLKHVNIHSKPFQCHICAKKFSLKSGLKNHIQNEHRKTEGDYKCSQCLYQTNTKQSFQNHLYKHTKPFECGVCTMKFAQNASLKSHMKNKHKQYIIEDYKCSECFYQTINEDEFQQHLSIHNKPFQCSICMMKFSVITLLDQHTKTEHTKTLIAKDHQCLKCPYQTDTELNLRRHLENHDKRFRCNICMMEFGRSNNLKVHVKNIHAEDGIVKEHKCPECNYETNRKPDLQKHLNTHNKPFCCGVCSKKFALEKTLKVHMKDKHRDHIPNDY